VIRLHINALLTLVALAVTLAAAGLGAAPAPAAKSYDCPATKGMISKRALGRVWHRGATLYGCTTVYGHRPKTKRLGPWTPTTRVAFDGVDVAWTVRRTVNYRRVDRIWAANIDSGRRWMQGYVLVPRTPTTEPREERVQSVELRDRGVAWITQAGDVVLALQSPQDEPEAIGAAGALKPSGRYLLVGSFTSLTPRTLAATLALKELPGDGDECGAVNPYELTVQPDPSHPPVGVRWSGYWQSTNCS
jgi:hypothetical protein